MNSSQEVKLAHHGRDRIFLLQFIKDKNKTTILDSERSSTKAFLKAKSCGIIYLEIYASHH